MFAVGETGTGATLGAEAGPQLTPGLSDGRADWLTCMCNV